MPRAVTPVPAQAAVPDAPGVPNMFRSFNSFVSNVSIIASDAQIIANAFLPPRWGIFDETGQPIVIPDTITEFEYRNEDMISQAPQEVGSFASYNKVSTPAEIRMVMVASGTPDETNAFMANLVLLEKSLTLVTVLTSDSVYPNFNVTAISQRRSTRNGATMAIADVRFQEIRITASSQFSNTRDPSGTATVDGGTVQPVTPSGNQITAAQGPT